MNNLKRYTLTVFFLCFLFNSVRAQDVLTNQSLIQMSEMKLSSNLIIAKIRASKNTFDLTTNGLLQLLTAKVSSNVIEATLQSVSLSDVMKNEDVIKLWGADLSRKLLTQKINASRSQFDVTTSGLIQLKTGKVPDQIVKVMMAAPVSTKPANPTTKQKSSAPTGQTQSITSPANSPETNSTLETNDAPDTKGVKCTSWVDDFTKKSVTVSRVILRGKKMGNILLGRGASALVGIENLEVTLLFRRDNKETVLVMYASKPGLGDLVVTRNKPLLLLMDDSSVMEFNPIMDSQYGISFDYGGYNVNSNLCVYYAINKGQLQQLSKKTVKKYRLHTYNRDYHEDTVNLSRAEQVQVAAQCMLN